MILARSARQHWFLLLLPILLLFELAFARSTDWWGDPVAEKAILFDLCLFVPALYLLCYRHRLSRKALIVRSAALFLAGIYLASVLVPPEGEDLLVQLLFLRPIGLLVLVLIELKLLIEILRLAFSDGTDARRLAERSGAPEWIARLMLIEARFWKWLWSRIRR